VVADRLYERLQAELRPEALDLALAEGGKWSAATAADRARQVLGPDQPSRISKN
jgi:hypothetical protein